MGQTLSHGVYLPAEGERNCYSGLASNWQILNTAVGAIAEKAPLVHTHTVSQITDFPAYGNTAGTICEGNDSRLSDARTPVAHTHTKSDVTNLLNSNFIPSANNSYDLGSSSYQWNNLYAKNYFYNGVAWGLDKENVWSGNNSFTYPQLTLKNSNITRGTIPNINRNYILNFTDSNNDSVGMIFQQIRAGSGSYKMTFSLNNGTTDHRFHFYGFTNGTSSLIPDVSGVTELGSSDNKWKTLNGINPGALSLPKIVAKNTANIASAIVGADGETQYLDGTDNNYTAALDGWISICISGFVNNELWITVYDQQDEAWGTSAESSTRNTMFIIFPIRANQKMRIRMKCTSVTYARFYPCEGNV